MTKQPVKSATSEAPAETENKAVTTTSPNQGALALPDFMRGQAGAGLENVDSSDVETPRVKLLQALSPEVETHEDARAGCFWHEMAERNLGKEVRCIPVYVDKRALLWRPRPEGGILARSDDLIHWSPPNATFEVTLKTKKVVTWRTRPLEAQAGLLNWGSSDPDDPNSPPAATLMYNFLMVFPDFPDLPPGVVTMQRSATKVARKLLGRLKIMRAPSYGIILNMSSFLDESPEGKFHNYRVTPAGYVTDEQAFEAYKSLYEGVRRAGLKVREEDEDETLSGSETTLDNDAEY